MICIDFCFTRVGCDAAREGELFGRNLDTYISKLFKKLKDDSSIKITNVHGVGYKLEIE